MPLDPVTMGVGAGLGGAGLIAGGIGQGMAARSMAKMRQRQLLQQLALQKEGNQNTQNYVAGVNPANQLAGARSQLSAAGASAIPTGGVPMMDMRGAGAANMASAAPVVAQDAMSQSSRLAGLAAPDMQRTQADSRLATMRNRQSELEQEAAEKAALYEQQLAAAANEGAPLRMLGQLGQLGGAGMMSYSMLNNRNPPPQAAPDYGWTSRIPNASYSNLA